MLRRGGHLRRGQAPSLVGHLRPCAQASEAYAEEREALEAEVLRRRGPAKGSAGAETELLARARPVQPLVHWNHALGNQRFEQLVRARFEEGQGRLHGGTMPHDPLEDEADRLADEAVSAPDHLKRSNLASRVSRSVPNQPQREAEQERTQPSEAAGGCLVPNGGRPLPEGVRSFFEPRFGHTFSNVRIHTDAAAQASARSLGARAYTVGTELVFAAGQYRPDTREGRRLLAHELTHVIQQTGSGRRVQRQPATADRTDPDRRGYVRDAVHFLNMSTEWLGLTTAPVTPALFEQLINSWYRMVVLDEQMLDHDLAGDPTLKAELRAAYIAAIRLLMSRAAAAFQRSEDDLYLENSGRIPMWAWQRPHRAVPGISTPIEEGRAVTAAGDVEFASSGFRVSILPDGADAQLQTAAETRIHIGWNVPYQWESHGNGSHVVSSFTAPSPAATIQTFYRPGAEASDTSAYGRGTTRQDVAGGAVSPRSTRLGFHEGHHGLAFVDFMRTHAAPRFTGAVGMTEVQFLAARAQFDQAMNAYLTATRDFSSQLVDCVGTTIDQHQTAGGGHQAALVCHH